MLPFRRRSIFEASACKPRTAGMSALTVLDVLGGVLFAFLAYNSATNAAIGPFSYAAQVTIVILTLKPNMLHTGSYCYNKSRGIDLKLTMAQLPPE